MSKENVILSIFPKLPEHLHWLKYLPLKLAVTLYNNWRTGDEPIEVDESPLDMAFSTNDIFVIQAASGSWLVFEDIIRQLLGQHNFPELSYEQYKKRLNMQNSPDFSLADSVRQIKSDFTSYALTYTGVVSTLNDLYFTLIPYLPKNDLSDLHKLASSLRLGGLKNPHHDTRLLQKIYAMPQNSIMYEDGGDLMDMDENENFEEIARIREDLISANFSLPSPYLSLNDRLQTINLLDKIIASLDAYARAVNREKNADLFKFLDEATNEEMHKLVRPWDGTKPYVKDGLAVIDLDACQEIPSAERYIIIGSYSSEMYEFFTKAAYNLQKTDGINRLVKTGQRSVHDVNDTIYLSKNNFYSHVMEMASDGKFIGVLTTDEGVKRDFEEMGFDRQILVGNLSDLYRQSFDMLYLTEYDERLIHIAHSKAKICLAVK